MEIPQGHWRALSSRAAKWYAGNWRLTIFMVKMKHSIPFYQIDAFTAQPFSGNPAAVCLLDAWPDDGLLVKVAAENNLSETAFLVPKGKDYELRWFTTATEVKLCGHATLASAFVVLHELKKGDSVQFHTRHHGILEVSKAGSQLRMQLPNLNPKPLEGVPGLEETLGQKPEGVFASDKLIAVLADEDAVRHFKPDIEKINQLPYYGLGITAPAKGPELDFVSRFFVPQLGIPEDPVTGSLHAALAPLWSKKLGKTHLKARQLSARGGYLEMEVKDDTVVIFGQAAKVVEGKMTW